MESKDRLEQFIIDKKVDFGPGQDLPDVWQKIEKRKPSASFTSGTVRLWLSRAASVAVIFALAYVFFVFTNKNGSVAIENDSPDQAMNELIEADEYYTAKITQRKSELFKLTESSPSVRDDVDQEFADLDAILLELRNDLQDNADNAEVIEAMMQHYRLKLEILEDMLEQVTMNNSNNQNEKGISI